MNKTHYTIREFFDKFPELANIRGVVSTRLRNLAYYGFIEKKAIKDTTPKSKWEYKKEDIITAIRHYCPDFLTATPAEPKYDPCRKFKRGDKVKLHHVHGRPATHSGDMRALPCKNDKNEDVIYEVVLDEEEAEEGNGIWLISEYLTQYVIVHISHIELVTPVEELEPYRVETGGYNKFRIKKGNLEYSYFPFGEHCVLSMDEAKAAAEAERDRLNAKHRKENN